MTDEEFKTLKVGDKIRSRHDGTVWDVVGPNPYYDGGWLVDNGADQGLAGAAGLWESVERSGKPVVAANPEHYKADKFETWDVIHAWQKTWPADIRYCVGSAVKYLSRLGRKQGANVTDDLEKAIAFLNKARELLKSSGE